MDKQLLEKLYDAYYQEIYLYVYALCKNHEWAADLTQETFLKALLSLDQSHTNMRAWLYTVARNLYYNEVSKNRRVMSYYLHLPSPFLTSHTNPHNILPPFTIIIHHLNLQSYLLSLNIIILQIFFNLPPTILIITHHLPHSFYLPHIHLLYPPTSLLP